VPMTRMLALFAVAVALAAPAASAKEGAQAHLLAPLPAHPVAGRLITVRWTVDVPGAHGKRVPFGAIGMFVRLIGAPGAATTATAPQTHGPPYSVRIRVPRGGVRAIRFGLHGTTDIFFPLR
jgi:hypothetical protein